MRRLWELIRTGRMPSSPIPQPGVKKGSFWDAIFGKHLLLFNIVSSGGLMFFGDIAAQEIEIRLNEKDKSDQKRYDWARVARMTAVGFWLGPLHHYYYGWVDRILPKADTRSVFWKIMMDQFIASPLFIVCYYFPAAFLEGKNVRETADELAPKFFTIYKVDWVVWPPVQMINFYFLPLRYRVLYINAITTLYNVFLCYIKHKDYSEEKHMKVEN